MVELEFPMWVCDPCCLSLGLHGKDALEDFCDIIEPTFSKAKDLIAHFYLLWINHE